MLDENIKNNIIMDQIIFLIKKDLRLLQNYQTALNLLKSLNISLTLELVKEE